MPHQGSKAANKAAINVAESVENLGDEATKREIVCIEGAFAACRAIGRGDFSVTRRACPRLGGGHGLDPFIKELRNLHEFFPAFV